MKTIVVSLAVVALTGLTSCKKEYTCHCEVNGGGDKHVHVDATSKKKAEAACSDVASANGYKECDLG